MLDKNIIDDYNRAFDSNLLEMIVQKANKLMREEAPSVILEQKTTTGQHIYKHIYLYGREFGASHEKALEKSIEAYMDMAGTSRGDRIGKLLELHCVESLSNILGKENVFPQYKHLDSHEKADVFVKYNNKEYIIMIQRDIWNGGHQANRLDKYVNKLSTTLGTNTTLFCLVLEPILDWKLNSKNKTANIVVSKHGREVIKYMSDLENFFNNLSK